MRNIYLVGMPSSGKSTFGKLLANELEYVFVDLDQLITDDQQMTIPEIFSAYGEPHFREVESRLLKGIPADSRRLIATGGGAPCFFDNLDFIRRSGLSIFVDVPVDELAARIRRHARDDRPLLSGLSDLEAELRQKLEHRRPFYSQADLTITPDIDPGTLARSLSALLSPG